MVRRRYVGRRARAATVALVFAGCVVVAPVWAQENTAAAPPLPPAVTLDQGVEVVVALKERLRSGEAKNGQEIRFRVANDVRSLDLRTVLVPAGTGAAGTSRWNPVKPSR